MKRTQIQLEEDVFSKLREIAYQRDVSVAYLIREAIDQTYGTSPSTPGLASLTFVGQGAGRSNGSVSENHDEELGEAFLK